jgi:hypothetical protein
MSTAEEYRALAERCRRMAKNSHNEAVAQTLRAMADDYVARAAPAQPRAALQQQEQPQTTTNPDEK